MKILNEEEIRKAHLKKELDSKDYISSGISEKPKGKTDQNIELEKRQTKALEEIAMILKKLGENGLNNQSKIIGEILEKIIEINQEAISSLFEKENSKKPKRWVFTMQRDTNGFISKVFAREE